MADLNEMIFRSSDGRFRVVMSPAAITQMICACSEAGRKETGGILIGRIEDGGANATVFEATPKPKDSGFGWFWFKRGTKGLRQILDQRWAVGQHYLGEWHFHPGGSPEPSGPDYEAMEKISGDPRYQLPEPILVIMGGSPPSSWQLSVTVSPRGEPPQRLLRQ
jgi:hypothetical protein